MTIKSMLRLSIAITIVTAVEAATVGSREVGLIIITIAMGCLLFLTLSLRAKRYRTYVVESRHDIMKLDAPIQGAFERTGTDKQRKEERRARRQQPLGAKNRGSVFDRRRDSVEKAKLMSLEMQQQIEAGEGMGESSQRETSAE